MGRRLSLPALPPNPAAKRQHQPVFQRETRRGGALAVFAVKIRLDRVVIKNCSAGARGGGGILLDEGTTADLIGGCELSGNKASASLAEMCVSPLSYRSRREIIPPIWPSNKPFPDSVSVGRLLSPPPTCSLGMARSGGGIFGSSRYPAGVCI